MELKDRIEQHTKALMPILDDKNFNRFEKIDLINQSIKEFVEQSPETGQVNVVVSVLDDCIEDINHELNAMGLGEEKVRTIVEGIRRGASA